MEKIKRDKTAGAVKHNLQVSFQAERVECGGVIMNEWHEVAKKKIGVWGMAAALVAIADKVPHIREMLDSAARKSEEKAREEFRAGQMRRRYYE